MANCLVVVKAVGLGYLRVVCWVVMMVDCLVVRKVNLDYWLVDNLVFQTVDLKGSLMVVMTVVMLVDLKELLKAGKTVDWLVAVLAYLMVELKVELLVEMMVD
jgi:hypothetical protein